VSKKNREAIFTQAVLLQKAGLLQYQVILSSAAQIDKKGIAPVIRSSISAGLKRLLPIDADYSKYMVKLDGGLKAPEQFVRQETIIKGDSKEAVIGLASILAKVTRDNHMKKLAKKYPEYGLEKHKGYGTKAHIAAIQKQGLTAIHRISYCRNIPK
jgi:ribonuclease HII